MDKKVTTEVQGIVKSILCWNSAVFITLETGNGLVKLKMPTAYFNNYKKIYVDDVIKIRGVVSNFKNNDGDFSYSATIRRGTVQRLIGKNKSKNQKLDYANDFCYVGAIKTAKQVDEEFYQIIFKEAGEDGDIHTIYMLKEDFDKAIENYDFRRLIKISGKTSITSCHRRFYDIPVTYFKNFAIKMDYI